MTRRALSRGTAMAGGTLAQLGAAQRLARGVLAGLLWARAVSGGLRRAAIEAHPLDHAVLSQIARQADVCRGLAA